MVIHTFRGEQLVARGRGAAVQCVTHGRCLGFPACFGSMEVPCGRVRGCTRVSFPRDDSGGERKPAVVANGRLFAIAKARDGVGASTF